MGELRRHGPWFWPQRCGGWSQWRCSKHQIPSNNQERLKLIRFKAISEATRSIVVVSWCETLIGWNVSNHSLVVSSCHWCWRTLVSFLISPQANRRRRLVFSLEHSQHDICHVVSHRVNSKQSYTLLRVSDHPLGAWNIFGYSTWLLE